MSGNKAKPFFAMFGGAVAEAVNTMRCDECVYYVYDEEVDNYFCSVDMDEDDYARLMGNSRQSCPYYRSGDEYEVVWHQM